MKIPFGSNSIITHIFSFEDLGIAQKAEYNGASFEVLQAKLGVDNNVRLFSLYLWPQPMKDNTKHVLIAKTKPFLLFIFISPFQLY